MKENYSESMDKKYTNKERKKNDINLVNTERIIYCSICGKEINTYDGDITTKTFGYPICSECLNKNIENINKIQND